MPTRRVVIIPGNGAGCAAANFYPTLAASLRALDIDVALADEMPDADTARAAIWLPFIRDVLGADSECVLVGHSSGALAALRLAEKHAFHAVIAVSVTDNDLGSDNERASGYYDEPWNWSAMRENVRHLVMFSSDDDPFIPIATQRSVARALEAAASSRGRAIGTFESIELKGRSHFFGRQQREIFDCVARLAAIAAEPLSMDACVDTVRAFITAHFAGHDASHDASHTLRVASLARALLDAETARDPSVGVDDGALPLVIALAALLHDVDDAKYTEESPQAAGGDALPLARDALSAARVDESVAARVLRTISGVSYSAEAARLSAGGTQEAPAIETAIVQDADRLEALGAIGIARAFAFGGARGRALKDETSACTVAHFHDKLLKLEGMMKTQSGRAAAKRRTDIMRAFLDDFEREWSGEV